MKYKEIQPPDHLKSYIRYCWILESNDAAISPRSFRTMADASPGLIFQHSDYGTLFQADKALSDVFLFGQSTRYTELKLSGSFKTAGIYFYPNGLKAIFGLKAEELTNSCLNMEAFGLSREYALSERLSQAPGVEGQLQVLFDYLGKQLKSKRISTDPSMEQVLSLMLESNGNISLKDLQTRLQLSERSFERKFKELAGISPKLFSRICRFQASLGQLRKSGYDKGTTLAFEQNYADQSHFIRSFKEFAGFSPLQYQKQSKELVENLSELTF
eukprot:gene2792-3213_t